MPSSGLTDIERESEESMLSAQFDDVCAINEVLIEKK